MQIPHSQTVDFLPSSLSVCGLIALNPLFNTTAILQLHEMETDILGSSSYEQGSSWAMEVGGHLKVHSILVENLSKNGQMLVEVCMT